MSLPVLWLIESYYARNYGSWKHVYEHGQWAERVRRTRSRIEGVSLKEDRQAAFEAEFGPAETGDHLLERIQALYDQHPEIPRRYKLPKHWHWMRPDATG